MNEKKVIQRDNGVEIIMPANADIDEVNEIIGSCSSGTNSCCPSNFLNENKIGVYEQNGKTIIKITGNANKEEVENNINSCSCFDK
ncbi:MAG: hypothetical protein RE471_00130 [Ferroplasma sp.]|uniref:hypothetical protein n=1 Tax=Ferroplasma sp. TaxID=2591003 RepID=UPI0028162FAB|nr:hypothetical protein [Ferroplasma sp.]WMT51309.1 MAG: hypothetical protein RE471_00130 [Ferroplasma sp.]